MSNSSRFLAAFNRIEKHLRQITREGKGTSFHALVTKASNLHSSVRFFCDDLREFADLRNAIVHESTDEYVIAEPNDRAIEHIEHIASVMVAPPRVDNLFRKRVLTLKTSDPVAKAVSSMLDQSFSQIPIYDGQECMALLTSNTIARWLGTCVEEDIISLKDTSIGSVLQYAEEQDNYCFLGRNATVFEAQQKFQDYERRGKRLDAVLITESSQSSQNLLGMITVWDLAQIYQLVGKESD